MTIQVGWDGTLYDDCYVVGQDDGLGGFGSALADIGSSLGSALGSSSGGGASDSGLGGSLSSLFSGTGDTGSAIGNVFGQLAKTALPAVTKAAEGAVSKALSHPSQQQPSPPGQGPAQVPSGRGSAQPSSALPQTPARRAVHAIDSHTRLNQILTRLAKKYNIAPPAKPAGFVSKMMGATNTPKSTGDFGPGF